MVILNNKFIWTNLKVFQLKENVIWVCKLKKSIYELKQALRQWYIKFNDIITSFGFEENLIDKCIYQKISGNKFIFLVLCVDEILLATNDLGVSCEAK